MPPPAEVPTLELRADDLFAMYAVLSYRNKIKAAHLSVAYQHLIDDKVMAFETWRRENYDSVVIPSVP